VKQATQQAIPHALRPLLGAVSLAAALIAPQLISAQTAIPDGVQRELNIMEEIFTASTRDRNNRGNHISPSESLYLPGQGMLFIFNMPGGFWNGNGFSNNFNGNFDFDFDFDDDNDGNHVHIVTPAPPVPAATPAGKGGRSTANATQNYRDKLQDLNEQMRDKQEEMRDLQRKQRELARQQRSDAAKYSQAEMDKVSKSVEKLGEEMSKLGTSINDAQKQYQQERNAEAETRGKQQAAVIFETLCKYGSTLQSLKSGEHVDLVMRNFGGNKTRVYVIEAASLKGCSSGDKLQQDAKYYSM
jgi:hypothetical protein